MQVVLSVTATGTVVIILLAAATISDSSAIQTVEIRSNNAEDRILEIVIGKKK